MSEHESEERGPASAPIVTARRPSRLPRMALKALLLVGALHVLGEWLEFTRLGSFNLTLFTEALGLGLFCIALILLGLPFWIGGLVVLRALGRQRTSLWHQVRWPLAYALLAIPFLFAGRRVRKAELGGVLRRARPLCLAIEAYTQDTGAAPAGLEDLVPEFLASVPSTGVGRCPEFGYLRGEEARRFEPCEWVVFTEAGQVTYYLSLYRRSDDAGGEFEFEFEIESRYGPEYGLPMYDEDRGGWWAY